MKLRVFVFLLAYSLTYSSSNPASASKGGVEQTNNSFVIGFTYSDNGFPSLCSGALVAPDVIATARHCVVNQQGISGSNYVFSAPGAKLDAPIDGSKVPTGVKQVIIPQQTPTAGLDFRLDVAFIVTNKPFATGSPISFATAEEIKSLSESSVISGYGYGAVFETGATYSSLPRKFDLSWKKSYLVEDTTSLYELVSENTTACRGDSGGPITLQLASGKEVLVGAVSGAGEVANGCGTNLSDGFYHLRMTVFYPYISQIPKPTVSPATITRTVLFAKGSSRLDAAEKKRLNSLKRQIKLSESVTCTAIGMSKKPSKSELKLAKARATSACKYLAAGTQVSTNIKVAKAASGLTALRTSSKKPFAVSISFSYPQN